MSLDDFDCQNDAAAEALSSGRTSLYQGEQGLIDQVDSVDIRMIWKTEMSLQANSSSAQTEDHLYKVVLSGFWIG